MWVPPKVMLFTFEQSNHERFQTNPPQVICLPTDSLKYASEAEVAQTTFHLDAAAMKVNGRGGGGQLDFFGSTPPAHYCVWHLAVSYKQLV